MMITNNDWKDIKTVFKNNLTVKMSVDFTNNFFQFLCFANLCHVCSRLSLLCPSILERTNRKKKKLQSLKFCRREEKTTADKITKKSKTT